MVHADYSWLGEGADLVVSLDTEAKFGFSEFTWSFHYCVEVDIEAFVFGRWM